MLTATTLAAEKLKEVIQAQTTDPEVAVRLVPSPSMPNRLEMALDKEREDDQVVESEGTKILFISPELAPALEGMVINCQETPQGVSFSISKLAPDT
jgi:Fe-S cluster assembly iron-binding protein IscA